MALPTSKIPALPFEISSFACAPKFPAVRFAAHAEFQEFIATSQETLDSRYAYEQTLASSEPCLVQQGTCAPCLRATSFTSDTRGGDVLNDGRGVPYWREAMQCDCKDPLTSQQRALLHFVQATGVLPWSKLLLLGLPAPVDSHLTAMVESVMRVRPFPALTEVDSFHFAVSSNYLQNVPQLGAVLARLCAGLVEGGRFVFTVPFSFNDAKSVLMDTSRFKGQVPGEFYESAHKFGWDLLDRLRTAGFRDAAAYLYWSEELGYLGPWNFIFRAVK
jgi:hypothetical protein